MNRVKDIMELDTFNQINLMAGRNGVNRIVRWPFVLVCQELAIEDWVKGSELLFFTGIGMKINEEVLNNLVEQCYRSCIAGIVVLLSPDHIAAIPESMMEKANQYNIPLFSMPWELPLIQVTKSISDYIYSHSNDRKVNNEAFIKLIDDPANHPIYLQDLGKSSNPDHFEYSYFVVMRLEGMAGSAMKLADYVSLNYFNTGFFSIKNNYICFLTGDHFEPMTEKKCQAAVDFLNMQLKGNAVLYAGISNRITNDHYLKDYYKQAQDALYSGMMNKEKIKKFNDTGIIKLLSRFSDRNILEEYYAEILSPILEYDQEHATDFVHTLNCFLLTNCSYIKAAKMLFIHRNTLSYRMEKITQLLNKDLRDPYVTLELKTALMIKEYFDMQQPIQEQQYSV